MGIPDGGKFQTALVLSGHDEGLAHAALHLKTSTKNHFKDAKDKFTPEMKQEYDAIRQLGYGKNMLLSLRLISAHNQLRVA